MLKRLAYRIDAAQDRAGNKKELPREWMESQYVLSRIKIGKSAVLTMLNSDNYLTTSKVEAVVIYDNTLQLITKNSVYWLEPLNDKPEITSCFLLNLEDE